MEISEFWMRPEYAKAGIWAEAINKLIKRRYMNRYCLMLLNCHPLYHKKAPIDTQGWRGRERWKRRRTALARLAQRKLALKPLPAAVGDDKDVWWMWRPLKAGVSEPRERNLDSLWKRLRKNEGLS